MSDLKTTVTARFYLVACFYMLIGLVVSSPSQAGTANKGVDTVQAALQAMGGVAVLEDLKTITVQGRTTHWVPGEAFQTGGEPRLVGNSDFLMSQDYAQQATRTEWNRNFEFPFPHPQGFIEIVTERMGFVRGVDATDSYRTMADLTSSPPMHAMSGVRLATEQREIARRSPHFLLAAMQQPDQLSSLPEQRVEGRSLAAIRYQHAGNAYIVMFDPDTHLPARIRVRDEDALQGDSDFDLVFSDWRVLGDLKFPYRMDYELNGARIAQIQYAQVSVNPELPKDFFHVPEDIAKHAQIPASGPVPYQWVIRRQYLGLFLDTDKINYDPKRGGLHLVSLALGVDQVLGGTHNSLVVEMNNYLIVFDAPINEWQSEWTLAAAAEKYPDKPVKYLVISHHHVDHSGGARTYATQGATIVVPKGDKTFFESVLKAPHTIEPDALQQQPGRTNILEVDGMRVLTDGQREVELYTVENTHVKNMLIGYLPDVSIGFVVDLWSPLRDTSPTGGQKALFNALQALGITPSIIAGGHGYSAPYNDLQRLMTIGR